MLIVDGLYGLRRSGAWFHEHLSRVLRYLGWRPSKAHKANGDEIAPKQYIIREPVTEREHASIEKFMQRYQSQPADIITRLNLMDSSLEARLVVPTTTKIESY
jgi:hypothetical protein